MNTKKPTIKKVIKVLDLANIEYFVNRKDLITIFRNDAEFFIRIVDLPQEGLLECMGIITYFHELTYEEGNSSIHIIYNNRIVGCILI